MRRREFITLISGAAGAWPLAARAQQRSLPVIGYIASQTLEVSGEALREFRQGLKDNGFVDGENVAIEYYFSGYQMERLPELLAELIRRRVAVIVAASGPISSPYPRRLRRSPLCFWLPKTRSGLDWLIALRGRAAI